MLEYVVLFAHVNVCILGHLYINARLFTQFIIYGNSCVS